jgi:hypothetical protein
MSTTQNGFYFRAATFCVNVLLISSLLLTLLGLGWEYSTRWYLSGFSNAVLPASSSPEQKINAILTWMANGPARATDYYSDESQNRDPVDTLNYKDLLSVCGTATNAFVNLASSAGFEARRLLLLDGQGANTNHVVAEVYIEGRWVIVDPSFHVMLKGSDGRLLTREELARPEILSEATRNIPGYDPSYNYQHTAFVHVARLPVAGMFLQNKLNSIPEAWQEGINWTVLLERESFDTIVIGVALLFLAACLRVLISWYGRMHAIVPISPWEQLREAGVSLVSSSPAVRIEKGFPLM